ncbi:DUF2934 domain-containing protein [Thalassococcus sp. BH17M4-6]|uniref:DUF2934 domain-containing protein n=1 Tax=Thalassococcus sp. BH17M4-6 TaxID=3413148 RepID=UPI003BD20240
MPAQQLDDAQIAQAAYFLWLEEGQPEGRDQDHWIRAVETLTPAAKPRKPRAKAAAPKKAAAKAPAAKAAAPKAAKAAAAKAKPAAKPRKKIADA